MQIKCKRKLSWSYQNKYGNMVPRKFKKKKKKELELSAKLIKERNRFVENDERKEKKKKRVEMRKGN